MIGLMSTLQRAGWLLPQLFAARYLADKPYKKRYVMLPAGLSRSLVLVLAVMIWLTQARPPGLIRILVTLTVATFWIGDGLASLGWFELLSKSIPPTRRGRLTSIGQVLSGTFGFAAGFFVEWMLSDRGFAFPNNYASLFAIGFGMLATSFIGISFIKEAKGISAKRIPTWREYIPQLWNVLKNDRSFRHYTLARQIFGLNTLATPFYMTFALEQLGLPNHVAGRYTSIGLIGGILAAMVFGWVNERRGTKRAMQISIIVTTVAPLLAILIPQLLSRSLLAWAYGMVFFAMQASMSSYMPAWTAYMLELAPETERPLYVGLTNSINGFSTLFSTLGGLILAWTGNNYPVLFVITAIGTLAAWPTVSKLPEPRTRINHS